MHENLLKKTLKYRWLIFWILAICYVLVYFHRQCTAVLAVDMMKDLKTGGNMMGLLGALYFYPYALMQLPAGLFSDSWGPRRTITLFFSIAVIGSLFLGLSENLTMAIIGRLMVGIGISMLFVPTMKVLAEWFKPNEFAMMTGILMAMGGLGSLISSSPLAFLSNLVGWRYSFIIVGIFTLVLAISVWLIVKDKPKDKNWPAVVEHAKIEKIPLWQGVRKIIKEPGFWFCGLWFFFTLGIFFSFGGLWGGPFLMNIYKLTKTNAGHILAMLAIGMVVGSPLLSILSNKILKSRKKVIMSCSLFTLFLTGLLAFNTAGFSIKALYLVCFFLGVCSSAVVVIAFTATKELFPVQIAGTSTGLVNLFPFAGGAVFQQILGYILQKHGKIKGLFTLKGYQHAFLALFICGIIGFIASLFIRETYKG